MHGYFPDRVVTDSELSLNGPDASPHQQDASGRSFWGGAAARSPIRRVRSVILGAKGKRTLALATPQRNPYSVQRPLTRALISSLISITGG